MILKISNSVFAYNLSTNAFKIYLYFLFFQDSNNSVTIKLKAICKGCNIKSKGTIITATRELLSKKLIITSQRLDVNSRKYINTYSIFLINKNDCFKIDVEETLFILEKSSFMILLYMIQNKIDDDLCVLSVRKIMTVLNLSSSTVSTSIDTLVHKNLIKKEPYNSGKSNSYRILYSSAPVFVEQYID